MQTRRKHAFWRYGSGLFMAVAACAGHGPADTTDQGSAAATVNLIQDPGFELQTVSGAFQPPWGVWALDGTAWSAGTDLTGYAHSGQKSGYVYAPDAKTVTWTAAAQTVTVTPNTQYHLTFWVVPSSLLQQGYIGANDGSGNNLVSTTFDSSLGTGYVQVAADFNSSSNTSVQVFAGLWSVVGQTVYINIDDASLTPDSSSGASYLGCYADSSNRDLPYLAYQNSSNTNEECVSTCSSAGYAYAGTQYGTQCFCGHSYGSQGSAANCNMACSGKATETCGGTWANSVYATGTGGAVAADGGQGADTGGGSPGHDAGSSSPPIVPAFYVATNGLDSHAGTEAAPFATLAKAQSAMQASSTIKTTYIRAGSYTLPTLNCGGGTCGLDLVSADDGETWSYYPPDGVDSAELNAGSTSASTGLTAVINVGANNITINGLSIHNFSYEGIGSGGGADKLLIENNVIYNGFVASGSSNPAGISCYGCSNMTISHNVIHDIAQFGVSVSNVNGDISNLLVTGNVVYNTCTAIADCGALYVQDIYTTATNMQFTDNYVHDGNTFAGLGSNSGSAIYADDCTSNVTETGNVITGRNGSNTLDVHGGSNVHQIGNLTDLATYAQHVATYQTSGVSACASATMSGNEYENNIVIGAGGGGGFALLSGSPKNTPTIKNNDYYNYGGAAISPGVAPYRDTDPVSVNPELSGWTYTVASGSPVLSSPVSFPPLVGGWGPPGYVLPQTGTAPTSPH